MKILAIIPARYASSRFPGKPLADIMGKPMIRRVYERSSEVFDDVVVATDDKRIYDAVLSFGGKAVMTSKDHRSGTDRCREAAEAIEKSMSEKYDIVVNIQGDEPFVDPEQLRLLVGCFDRPGTQISTLVRRLSDDSEVFDENTPKVVVDDSWNALYFSRSPIPFLRGVPKGEWASSSEYYGHIGLYAFRRDVLDRVTSMESSVLENAEKLEQLRWLAAGFRISVAVTDVRSHSVDVPSDIAEIEKYFAN